MSITIYAFKTISIVMSKLQLLLDENIIANCAAHDYAQLANAIKSELADIADVVAVGDSDVSQPIKDRLENEQKRMRPREYHNKGHNWADRYKDMVLYCMTYKAQFKSVSQDREFETCVKQRRRSKELQGNALGKHVVPPRAAIDDEIGRWAYDYGFIIASNDSDPELERTGFSDRILVELPECSPQMRFAASDTAAKIKERLRNLNIV